MASSPIPSPPDTFPPELERFVFSPDTFQKADFPRGLMPREIESFVRTRIHPGVAAGALEQLFLVVDHHDVHEVVPPLLAMIEPSKQAGAARTPVLSLPARIAIIKTAAVTGLAADRARAAGLFKAACAEVAIDNLTLCQTLIETYEVACLTLDAAPLAERLAAAAGALARFETSADPADAERRRKFGEFDALVKRLQRAGKAAGPRRAILALPDRAQRITKLVRVYLDLPADVPGYHIDWAARQLRREAWARQPAAQVERTHDKALRDELAAAFRAVLAGMGKPAPDDAVGIRQRVAALDAILYFNGVLDERENAFLATNGMGYVMPLSVRQIFPQP